MNYDELAAEVREALVRHHWSEGWKGILFRIGTDEIIADAIRKAVEEEREACAKIAERDWISGDWPPAKSTVDDIRARKEKT